MARRLMLIPIAACLFSLSCSLFSVSGVTNTTSAETPSNAGVANPATPKTKQDSDSSTSGTEPIRARIGEVITDNTVRIVVHGWNIVTPSKNLLPEPSNKLINVEYSFVNIGEEMYQVGFFMDVRLEDAQGHALPRFKNNDLADNVGYVFPGERFHVSSILEVPENTNGFVLDFGLWDAEGEYVSHSGLFPFQEVLVDLGSEPFMGDTAIEIPGEVKPKVESMGSTVACGGWSMQVLHVRNQKGSNFMPVLPEGVMHFVLGEITMTNQGTDTLSLHDVDFWMQDPTGLRFDSYPAQVVDFSSSGVDGSYAPAEQKTGIVGFGIPVNSGPMWLVFWCGKQSSPWQAQKVYVSVPVFEE
jgi:hypothetical protein